MPDFLTVILVWKFYSESNVRQDPDSESTRTDYYFNVLFVIDVVISFGCLSDGWSLKKIRNRSWHLLLNEEMANIVA